VRSLTDDEARRWCATRRLTFGSKHLEFRDAESQNCFSVNIERRASSVVALAEALVPEWEGERFDGALLWITARGIWGDHNERTATRMFERMHGAADPIDPVGERPAQRFEPGELRDLHAFLAVPLLFGWDAYVALEEKDYILFVCHDGVVGVVSASRDTHEALRERVRDWDPRDDPRWYFGGA